MTWNNTARHVQSKGLLSKKATSLADLHRRRAETGAQFYTPEWVAEAIWSVLTPAVEAAFTRDGMPVAVLDNSVGNGRLLAPAPKDKCAFYGCDIDARCIEALSDDAGLADVHHEFLLAGMESVAARGMGCAVINPPFSITLQSPVMEPYDCAHYGKFGPQTAALSHEYALAHALEAADIVAALLPVSMEPVCLADERLVAIYSLPADAFKTEGALVRTAVYVFNRSARAGALLRHSVVRGEPWPSVNLSCTSKPRFKVAGVDESEPTITLPVTHDRRVGLHHHNRRLILTFSCGLTQAKVLNGLLVGPVIAAEGHRYPANIRYQGDGKLLLDTLLLQADPQAAFDSIIEDIRAHGGDPIVSPTLAGYFWKLVRRHARAITPLRHVVRASTTPAVTVRAKRGMLLRMGDLKSPAIRKGQEFCAEALGGSYRLTVNGQTEEFRRDELEQRFEIVGGDERAAADWQVVHAGLIEAFPVLARQRKSEITQKGIDWLWPYQCDSLTELMIYPYGAVAAWQQGTGKARLAIALALLSGKASLIVVESGLVEEMLREIGKVGLDPSLWQVIQSASDVAELKQINLVSYNRLKATVGNRKTIAHLLRRRIHTLVADEGGLLSNEDTLQSRAVMQVSAQRVVVLDGSPLGNYARDMLPVASATAGNAVAHQKYGLHNQVTMLPELFNTASYATRGVEHFKDLHVVLDWCTTEFGETLKTGAKREVPKINNLPIFRQWLAPFVQRRLRDEPEVAPHAGCPKPTRKVVELEWDRAHLAHYLDVAVNFAHWYQAEKRAREMAGKNTNLIAVLARIQAVVAACDHPHIGTKVVDAKYAPLTSKQRWIVRRVSEHVAAGKKTIVYAQCPKLLNRLHLELEAQGISSVLFHGERNIKQRTKELDDEFRFGDTPVLLSSWVGQRGLNLPQAKRVIFASRNFGADTEDQALARTTRPDQDEEVLAEYVHLRGSINHYIGQVVEWKQAAADAGLDWGDGATDADVFHHMDSILEAFCRDTLEMSAYESARALGMAS